MSASLARSLARSVLVLVVTLAALLAPALPATAQRAPQVDRLMVALRVADMVAIMRHEGLAYGADLGAEMMPGLDRRGWQARLERLYDHARMQAMVEESLARELRGVDPAPLLAFFDAPLGARVVALELSAREAFLDPATEEAANARYIELADEGARIVGQIDTMIAESDLVERNVSGALNATLMLYRGLADGGAWDLDEDAMLRDIWAQEAAVRADSQAWLGAYLLTAYTPLDGDAVDRYLAMWRTPEGRALNAALFVAFDRLYEELSYLVGRALAEHKRGQDL
ncbi:MAG: DUF2059 domain-containing protein [Roseovarius sp.]|nr:DUF2059 domain-containing protein [Roseovarius sp.]